MPFITQDRFDLVSILSLHRDQMRSRCELASLMKCLEDFDLDEGTDLVLQVQGLITEYKDTVTNKADIVKNPDGLEEVELDRDYRVKFGSRTKQEDNYLLALKEIKQKIRNLLDPENVLNCFLNSESQVFTSL